MSRSSTTRQRGAALLLAMMVLTLISTVAAGMVWQQSSAIQIEAAERARSQAGWMLQSGIDFAREVVRRYGNADPRHDQAWDSELAETRLSALLAADRDNSADASLEAFISGRVDDAQSRYNLRNLVTENQVAPLSQILTLPQLFLSGVFFARDAVPALVRPIADYLPLTFLNDALRAVATTGAGPGDLGKQITGLLIWSIVSFVVAVRVFRFESS